MKVKKMPCEVIAAQQLTYVDEPSDFQLKKARQEKLDILADAIDSIETLKDGSLYLKTKSHLIIESTGNQIMYSKEGDIVIKSRLLHLNPQTPINNVKDSDYVDRIRIDSQTLLQTKQISTCNKDED